MRYNPALRVFRFLSSW